MNKDERLAKAIDLIKAFVANEQSYQNMLDWKETETYRQAQQFLQESDYPSCEDCEDCGFYHPGGSCLDS